MRQPELTLLPRESLPQTAEQQITIIKDKGNARTLKIEAIGDSFYGDIKPRIRLCGLWLERAGFKPGHHVQLTLLRPGEMILQFIEAPESDAKEEA